MMISTILLVFKCICFLSIVRYAQSWVSSVVVPSSKLPFAARTTLFMSTSSSEDISAAAATSATAKTKPSKGDVVTVECSLIPQFDLPDDGPLFDGVGDTISTLQFVLGFGNYIPALHDLIGTMDVGTTLTDQIIDCGEGSMNPSLIAEIQFDTSGIDKTQIKIGTQLYLASGVKCRVTAITDTTFTIDANPPSAGKSYLAKRITLVSFEPGPTPYEYTDSKPTTSRYEVATFGLGCFWGGELEFMRVPGVVGTAVGYTQGNVVNPSYKEVCSGSTGHTEGIIVYYDPAQVSYETLCTTAMQRLGNSKYLLNQVGNDRGTQYRHGIYYHNKEQKDIAEQIIAKEGSKCVTECKPAKQFYMAEDYHQQYLLKGGQSARKNDSTTIRCYG